MSSGNIVHLLMGPGYGFETVPGSDLQTLLDDLLLNRINLGAYFNTALVAPGHGFFLIQPPEDGTYGGVYYPGVDCGDEDSVFLAATLAFHAGARTRFSIEEIGTQILHMISGGEFQYLRIVDMGTNNCRFWESGGYTFE